MFVSLPLVPEKESYPEVSREFIDQRKVDSHRQDGSCSL